MSSDRRHTPIRYCRNCFDPDTRPGQEFTAGGLCVPCSLALQPNAIDWEARRRELREIAVCAKERARHGYDCVIGFSGVKDSTRLALFARRRR